MSNSPAAHLEQVHKAYGSRVALRGLNLTVERGRIFGLLGPNGAGKTTTLRLIMGYLKADKGRVETLGLDCWQSSAALKRKTGFLSADTQLYPWLTPQKALTLFSKIRCKNLNPAGEKLCRRLGLDQDLKVRQMSRGNRQKLGLVLALAHEPELIVLDEPTSGFDPLVQNIFAELMRERAEGGATVLLSSHTFAEVDRLCDSVAIVKAGEVIVQDDLPRLRERAARRVTLVFEDARPREHHPKLDFVEQRLNTVTGQWRGATGPLVQWCAEKEVIDLEISPPLLDDAFMEFYR